MLLRISKNQIDHRYIANLVNLIYTIFMIYSHRKYNLSVWLPSFIFFSSRKYQMIGSCSIKMTWDGHRVANMVIESCCQTSVRFYGFFPSTLCAHFSAWFMWINHLTHSQRFAATFLSHDDFLYKKQVYVSFDRWHKFYFVIATVKPIKSLLFSI